MQHEHELITRADIQPGEWQTWKSGVQRVAVVADFDDQDAVFGEVLRGMFENEA